jgi:hypothetical protein
MKERPTGAVDLSEVYQNRSEWLNKHGFKKLAEPVTAIKVYLGVTIQITSDMGEVYERTSRKPVVFRTNPYTRLSPRTIVLSKQLFLARKPIYVGNEYHPEGSLVVIWGYT